MFQSFEYLRYLAHDKTADKYRHQYKIIDTDFEEDIEVALVFPGQLGRASVLVFGVIETYRKRNLPVVPNLILFWQYYSKRYGHSMEQLIEWSKKHNPYSAEYEDEINKYLLLL